MILCTPVVRARPNICRLLIYQIWSAECKRSYWISKNYFAVTLSNSKASFEKKPRRAVNQRKTAWLSFIWFCVHWLAEHAPKSVKYRFTKLAWLTPRDTKKGAKIIFRLPFLTWRWVLRKNQRRLLKREKLRECLIFDSRYTGWQSMPQNLFNINLPNLVGWFQETLRSKSFFGCSSFWFENKFSGKNKKHYEKTKKGENVLYLILSAVVGRARPNIC